MTRILLLGILLFAAHLSQAQERVVKGKITDAEEGSGIPGVNVILKGTSAGTVTDGSGEYTISVPSAGGTLVFSFIGYRSQEVEVGTRDIIDVNLSPDVTELSEVVVTALGVEKSSRSLGYSVAKVDGEDLVQTRSTNVLGGMQGKIAGVQISGSSGAPGASNKVIIRGFTSLNGGNNPLYIVDGIPVNNSFTGSTGLDGASDFGSRINDLNPEDVESVTVLKGAAATQLYGSRAAAGVIIITTKKGATAAAQGKKAQVSVSSSLVMENPLKLPTFQNERGQGFYGSTSRFLDENTSWGSKFDGQLYPWGSVVNNQQRVKPFVALPDNVKDFFETGKTFTNSVSLQGGSKEGSYYISYSNVKADGIMPTDVDSYKRNTVSVRGSTQLANNLRSTASLNYARTESSFVPTGQGQTVYNQILQTPRDISLLELKDLSNPFNDIEGYYSPYTNNPWLVIDQFKSKSIIDRLYGNVELGYKATDWLDLLARVGSDVANTTWEQTQPKLVIEGPNASKSNPGNYSIQTIYSREFNTDLMANFNKDLSDEINLSGLIGFNINQRSGNTLFSQINDLVIPGYYNLNNTANTPTSATTAFIRRLYGVYAQANVAFRDYLFLSASARNDWSSTLPKANNSFFYPSVNVGLDLTTALGLESNTLTYAKLRAGYAQAGKDADPYNVQSVFIKSVFNDGFITLGAPFGQSIPAFEVSNVVGNQNLSPELSTETEIGADLRFLGNRIGLDVTYYDRKVSNNILAVPVTASSGYTSQILNIAELTNKGVEVLLNLYPVRNDRFSWNLAVNFSKNVSEITDLGGPDRISVGGLGGNRLIARVGGPAFEIEGTVPLLDEEGHTVVDGAGLPINNPTQQVIANTNYKWVGGVTNKLSYKGISLSGTFDVRHGGQMYSRTASLMYFAGTTPATLYNDRRPFIVPNSVTQALDGSGEPLFDDNGDPVYRENTTPVLDSNGQLQNFWSAGGFDIQKGLLVSKSFVKLRELSLSYSLPKSVLAKTPFGNVDISLIGRNLLLWVPDENVFIDPEQTTFGTDINSEFGEFGSTPTTRSYGFNIRLTL